MTHTKIGHWPLDENTGDVLDHSSRVNDGSVNGATHGAAGPLGPDAMSFDGTDDYIDIGDTNLMPGLEECTVTAWALLGVHDGNHHRVLSQEKVFYAGANGNSMALYFGDGSSWVNNTKSAGTFPKGQWVHVAYVKTASGGYLYLDGALQGSIGAPTTLGDNTNMLAIGAQATGGSQYWDGRMGDIRIYNRAMSPSEISYMHEVGRRARTVTEVKTP